MQNYELSELENFPQPPVKKDFLTANESPISPNNPPWNSWAAFGVWIASIAFIVVFPNVFLFPYLAKQNLNFSDQQAVIEFAKTDPTAVLLQICAVIPAHICTLILAWLVVTRFRKYSFRETLGWKWNGFSVWNCLIIVGGFYVIAAVAGYFLPEQENEMLRILKSSRAALYIVAFLATFTAPLVEEVIYRGILYSAFQRTFQIPIRTLLANYRVFHKLRNLLLKVSLLSPVKALLSAVENSQKSYPILFPVLLVTFIFALIHVPQYYPSYSTIFLICLLSLVLTLIRVRTGNLLPCIALHTVFNGTQSLLLVLQPFIENYIKTHQAETTSLIQFFK